MSESMLRPNFILRIFLLRILGANFLGDCLETEDFHPLKIRNWLSQTSWKEILSTKFGRTAWRQHVPRLWAPAPFSLHEAQICHLWACVSMCIYIYIYTQVCIKYVYTNLDLDKCYSLGAYRYPASRTSVWYYSWCGMVYHTIADIA